MALLLIDGFDEYGDITEMISSYTGGGAAWTGFTGNAGYAALSTTTYRTAQTGLTSKSIKPNWSAIVATLPASAEIIVGFGLNVGSGDVGSFSSLSSTPPSGGPTATNGIYLKRNADGSISACKCSDNAVYATTAASVLIASVWNYFELRYKPAASGGVIELRSDGATILNFSGDTSAGITTIASFALGSTFAYSFAFDDVYACDGTGATNNTFLGPIQVYTMIPTADSSVQMTRSAGAVNASCVDEVPANTTDYVTGTAANQVDLYTMSDLPASITTATIPGVSVKARSQKPNSNTGNLQLVTNYSATTATSPNKSVPTTTWINNQQVFETQPDTSAWTVAAVNGLNAGVKTT